MHQTFSQRSVGVTSEAETRCCYLSTLGVLCKLRYSDGFSEHCNVVVKVFRVFFHVAMQLLGIHVCARYS